MRVAERLIFRKKEDSGDLWRDEGRMMGGCGWPASRHYSAAYSLPPPAGQGENRRKVRRLVYCATENLMEKEK